MSSTTIVGTPHPFVLDRVRVDRLVKRLLTAADNLATGKRETPQRFIPVAWLFGVELADRFELVRYLLREVILEAEEGLQCPPEVLSLLKRLALVSGETGRPDLAAIIAMEGEINALVPLRSRRRSIHCHGYIASDRRLLLARAVLMEAKEWPPENFFTWYRPYQAVAYAMSDYDYDHFVMLGASVERRVRRLAAWIDASCRLSER